ncbi:virB8 family protein [Caballeronia sp. KNU42]
MSPTTHFSRALDWEASTTEALEKSERRAWRVAYASVAVAVLCAVGLAVMAPFYRIVPLVIEVNRLTGAAQVVDVTDAQKVRASDIQDEHWVGEYVETRERYLWGILQRDYDHVLNMSDPAVARQYRDIYDGPNAQDRELKSDTEWRIRILSITLPPGEPGRAVVRFERTVRKNGVENAEPPTRYVATLAFTYRPSIFVREQLAIDNPLGFKVTAYRVDPEFTSPGVSHEAAQAATAASTSGSTSASTYPRGAQ